MTEPSVTNHFSSPKQEKPRNWHDYNEKLVNETVDLFVKRDMLESFKKLDSLNKGKVGHPFVYSNSVILMICAVKEYFRLPYRQTEGFADLLAGMWGASIPNYSQICRRQKTLNIPLDIKSYDGDQPVDIIIDSSGLKVSNRGEWMRQKWKVRRGFVKIHLTCDKKTHRITSAMITDEYAADSKEFKPLVTSAKERVKKIGRVFGDTAYDSRANFNHVGSIGAEPVIKPRANSSGKSKGSYLRGKTAKEFIKDPKAWKENYEYGQRWQAETSISTFKRSLGECVTSILPVGIINEVLSKCLTYNILTEYRGGTTA